MTIETLLRQLADEYIEHESDQPTEFQHAGDLLVRGNVVFSSPNPPEYSACGDVPAGAHPVYVGVTRRRHAETGEVITEVTMVFVPLAPLEEIAGAEFEDLIEDWQPLGPELGFLWDAEAMGAFRSGATGLAGFADLDALVDHVTAELAVPGPDGQARAWVNITVDPASGLNVLAFPVGDENALCLGATTADGSPAALLFRGCL